MKISNKKLSAKRKIIYSSVAVIIFVFSWFLSRGYFEELGCSNILEKAGLSQKAIPGDDFNMSVSFLDVGKADCAYIKCGETSILIDAADKEPSDVVVQYLHRQNVSKLDLVIASHPHRDHIGQMDTVINEFEVKKFIEPKVSKNIVPTSVTYEKMLKALKNQGVNASFAKAGDVFNIGEIKVEILGPVHMNDNLNNNSVVARLTYKDVSFLFTGDAEKEEEKDILSSGRSLKANVLKVGHHGSKTSSTLAFLRAISPMYCVISVGPDRSNLPKEKTLNLLNKVCKNVYRTDLNGMVKAVTNGKKIKIITEK